MKHSLPTALIEAMRRTKASRLAEAAAVLQRRLGDRAAPSARRDPPPAGQPFATARTAKAAPAGPAQGSAGPQKPGAQMPGVLGSIFDWPGQSGFSLPGFDWEGRPGADAGANMPSGARFTAETFSNGAGSRPYKLYVPSSYDGRPAPLVVMLHGCTQSPDDFAVGTRMNEAAERHGCLVAYPGQVSSANMQRCWNWFNEGDQRRDAGEPSLIAGITRQVMRGYAVDPQQVFVAGLSAGGAAAAVMGDAYPDLYAAVGVHSGLACGAARDMHSALTAMRSGGAGGSGFPARQRVVPTIVFHGDRDLTVNPRNGDAVAEQAAGRAALAAHVEAGQVPGGHAFRRTRHTDANGQTVVEQWVVHGAAHAWFGGSAAGSYTDPRGPDATGEMLRFFLAHPHPAPSSVS